MTFEVGMIVYVQATNNNPESYARVTSKPAHTATPAGREGHLWLEELARGQEFRRAGFCPLDDCTPAEPSDAIAWVMLGP